MCKNSIPRAPIYTGSLQREILSPRHMLPVTHSIAARNGYLNRAEGRHSVLNFRVLFPQNFPGWNANLIIRIKRPVKFAPNWGFALLNCYVLTNAFCTICAYAMKWSATFRLNNEALYKKMHPISSWSANWGDNLRIVFSVSIVPASESRVLA